MRFCGRSSQSTNKTIREKKKKTLWLTAPLRKPSRNLCSAPRQEENCPLQMTKLKQKAQTRTNGRARVYSQPLGAVTVCAVWRPVKGCSLSSNCRAELCGELGKYRARQHCALSHGCGHELAARKNVFNWGAEKARQVPGMPVQECRPTWGKCEGNDKKPFKLSHYRKGGTRCFHETWPEALSLKTGSYLIKLVFFLYS